MAGYYLQSRKRDWNLPSAYKRVGTSAPFETKQVITGGKQQTWSFRTGRLEAKLRSEQDEIDPTRFISTPVEIVNRYDTGHEFYTYDQRMTWSIPSLTRWYQNRTYWGSILPIPYTETNFKPSAFVQWTNSSFYGNRAMARTIPTLPESNIAQFLSETIQRMPALIGAASAEQMHKASVNYHGKPLKTLKEQGGLAGEEFLNLKFGWEPFLADIRRICIAVLDSSKIIQQYKNSAFRGVHREYNFHAETTDQVSRSTDIRMAGQDSNDPTDGRPIPNSTYQTSTVSRHKFVGEYLYYLDLNNDLMSKMSYYEQLANKLLGTRMTPDVLWELAPWSWFVDWFVDVQSAMTVNSAFQNDRLVLKYGYVMRERVTTRIWSWPGFQFGSFGYVGPGQILSSTTSKERVRATPFGFGLNPNSFTSSQWAIVAALGLTKADKILRYR